MKLSELFVGWYEYSQEEYDNILKNALISFDTNVLLNTYKYSKTASKATFEALKTIRDRILLSFYVAKEFTNTRKKVKIDNIREYDSLSKQIESKFAEINIELDKYGEKKLSKINEIKSVLEKSKERATKHIENEKKTKSDFYKTQEIENNISEIFLNRLTPEYNEDEFKVIKEEGLRRIANKIPPGYMDNEKEENGDYYIFQSLIDYCKNNQKDLIFITNDKKEDWFRNISGIKEPREELIREFCEKTNQKLIIMDFDKFIKNDVIFTNKISEEVVSEIYEINRIQDLMSNRGLQRIQKYLNLISQFNTIEEIQNNLEDILKNYRTIMRISEGVQDYSLAKKVEKLYYLLREGAYEEYINFFKHLNVKVKNYKLESEIEIKNIYNDYNKTFSEAFGMLFLEKMSFYIRDYFEPTYTNKVLLTKSRELKLGKKNGTINDDTFRKEITNIYNYYFNEIESKIEGNKIYE